MRAGPGAAGVPVPAGLRGAPRALERGAVGGSGTRVPRGNRDSVSRDAWEPSSAPAGELELGAAGGSGAGTVGGAGLGTAGGSERPDRGGAEAPRPGGGGGATALAAAGNRRSVPGGTAGSCARCRWGNRSSVPREPELGTGSACRAGALLPVVLRELLTVLQIFLGFLFLESQPGLLRGPPGAGPGAGPGASPQSAGRLSGPAGRGQGEEP